MLGPFNPLKILNSLGNSVELHIEESKNEKDLPMNTK